MAIDTSTPRSRRGVLTAAAAAAAAAVAVTATRAERVFAGGDDGSPILIGQSYTDVQGETHLENVNNDSAVFTATSAGGGSAIYGQSDSGLGVGAASTTGTALQGSSTHGFGIYGQSGDNAGVFGFNDGPEMAAVIGQSSTSAGVFGFSGPPNSGILPTIQPKVGVLGISNQGADAVGVRGSSSTGRGAVFKGKVASVRLTPATTANHPASGSAGDLYVDSSNRLWFCRGGATWVRLA